MRMYGDFTQQERDSLAAGTHDPAHVRTRLEEAGLAGLLEETVDWFNGKGTVDDMPDLSRVRTADDGFLSLAFWQALSCRACTGCMTDRIILLWCKGGLKDPIMELFGDVVNKVR